MKKFSLKATLGISGLALLTIGVAVDSDVFNFSNLALRLSHASTPPSTITLNSSNSPTLSGGAGTMVDNKGVTWEYFHASDYNNGHVTLNAEGYVGVAANNSYAITAITSVNATFTGSDLWILRSDDGITWHDGEILTTGEASTIANNWRYIRFYNHTSTVNINSITINYACSGISPTEDLDSAFVSNVETTTSLSYTAETTNISPKSIGGEAVRFAKIGSPSSTNLTIKFNKSYTLGEAAYSKIEFDIWTQNVAYGKTIEVLNTDGSYKSNLVTAASGLHVDNPTDSYVWTSLDNDWYHVELPITAIVSLISGYLPDKDIPVKNVDKKTFNAIKINAGNCVIDNLRIGSSACELGIFNSKTYKPAVGEKYWVKTSWVGKLYPDECNITFSDNSKAVRILPSDPNLKFQNEFPFYVELLATGTLTITVTVVCGYNHRTQTIQNTITIQ